MDGTPWPCCGSMSKTLGPENDVNKLSGSLGPATLVIACATAELVELDTMDGPGPGDVTAWSSTNIPVETPQKRYLEKLHVHNENSCSESGSRRLRRRQGPSSRAWRDPKTHYLKKLETLLNNHEVKVHQLKHEHGRLLAERDQLLFLGRRQPGAA